MIHSPGGRQLANLIHCAGPAATLRYTGSFRPIGSHPRPVRIAR